jgi:CHAT domain-containing protein
LPPGLSPEARQAYLAAADRLADLRWRRRERPEAVNPEFEAELEQANRAWLALDAGVERLRAEEEEELPPPPAPERLAECLSPGEAAVALHVATDWIGATAVGRERSGSLWWGCETDGGLTLAQLSRAVVGRADGDDATVSPAWQDLARLPLDQAAPLIARTCVMLRERVWPLVERVLDGRADALVLMPGRGLNVLPLHAAPTTDGRLAMDRWCVRYAPSLGLLARAGAAGALPPGRILGQAVNPTGDLRFAETEADGIRGSWRGETRDPLRGPEAQPDRVLPLFEEADALHFAGHGAFDPEDPMRSRLFCAPGTSGDVITLQTLLERVPATRARVVLLSACETGRVVAGDPLNDQLGLPGGLLIAGASAVLATHWKVDDFAACLVLSRAIELWERDSLDLERALAAAQAWLRGATVSTVRGWIEERIDASSAVNPELERAYAGLAGRRDTERLFSAAIFWAPFHVTGRAVRAH